MVRPFCKRRGGPLARAQVNLNTADLGGDMYFDLGWGQLSPGRVCHQVLIFI
jgi:hypothetical protein